MEATDKSKITPVINLNLLYEAIEWIKAASDFKKFGDSEGICKLLPNEFENAKVLFNDGDKQIPAENEEGFTIKYGEIRTYDNGNWS